MTEHKLRNEPVELRTALVSDVSFEDRIITVRAVPYDEEAAVEYMGRMLRESVAPGAFDGIEGRDDHVTVRTMTHDPSGTVGKVVAYRTDDPTGLIADLYISEVPDGDKALRLAADGVLKASVGMVVRRSDQIIRQGSRRIKRAFLDHVALVPNPAYKGAGVLAVRQEQALPAAEQQAPPLTPRLDAVLAMDGIADILDR